MENRTKLLQKETQMLMLTEPIGRNKMVSKNSICNYCKERGRCNGEQGSGGG